MAVEREGQEEEKKKNRSSDLGDASPSQSGQPAVLSNNPLDSDNWADHLPSSDHVRFFQTTDWSATLLGPLRQWSHALRLHTFTVFADSRPSCLYWGPLRVAIYNQAFMPLAGKAHPRLMGAPFQEGFPEIWDHIRPVFDKAARTGLASDLNEFLLMVERNESLEETYFTGNFVPLRGDSGRVDGFFNVAHEVTEQKINHRRMTMIGHMKIPTGTERDTFESSIMPALASNPQDIPMALLYQVDEDSIPDSCLVRLSGQLGIPTDHPLLVKEADINSTQGLIPLLHAARSNITTIPVDARFEGVEWRGFGDAATHVSALPLSSSGRLFAFLVIAMNPRRPLDDACDRYLRDLSRHISTIISAMITTEETRKRAERLERELADSETKIRYMAQHASVGMQHLAIDGTTLWANEQFYKLTNHPRPDQPQYRLSFLDVYLDADRARAIDAWTRLLQGESDVSVELRLKRMFTPPYGDPEHACILALSFPYIEVGKVKSVMTCTTDISQLKWAESSEARNARDALAAKRQQEEFIDVVSHEMRNPLSAIFQCADMIASCLGDRQVSKMTPQMLAETISGNIDGAKTILMCANHQKRIVDDVLTLSKLEYMMLSISPSAVQPAQLVEGVMRMFESDLLAHDITVRTTVGASTGPENVDRILCDPSRVTQILINLLTNAIKFTRTEKKREITIRFGANASNPRETFSKDIHWCPRANPQDNKLIQAPEWGTGEVLYLSCAISDTGVGMTSDEISRVFSRFEQASSRTSIKYGGSGLGLFISQKLAEKHGGDIGVSSTPGKGSTFVFYIMGRRAQHEIPKDAPRPIVIRTKSSSAKHDQAVQSDKTHVLLVEDNLVNQQLLRKQLEKANCIVYVANHGAEALDVLETTTCWHKKGAKSKHLDIILMDWEMPVMDGLTCSRQIRNLQRSGEITRHICIIAITANAREEQIEAALGAGIDSVLSKPFLVADLLQRMKELLTLVDSTVSVPVASPTRR